MNNPDLRGLVDLETSDRRLEDLIICEYEGEIFEEQHRIVKENNGDKLYQFFRLRIIYLLKFLGDMDKIIVIS